MVSKALAKDLAKDLAKGVRCYVSLWIQKHREHATVKAREMVEQLRRKGDTEGADEWLEIIVAIGTLGTPPTDARH